MKKWNCLKNINLNPAMRKLILLASIVLTACSIHNPGPSILYEMGKAGVPVVGEVGTIITAISLPKNIAEARNNKKRKERRLIKLLKCLKRMNKGKDKPDLLILKREESLAIINREKRDSIENNPRKKELQTCVNHKDGKVRDDTNEEDNKS